MAGYDATNPETGFPVFAFRLHQFISRGDTVYASLEARTSGTSRPGQQFVPGDREPDSAAAGLLPGVRPGVLHGLAPTRTARPAKSPIAPRELDRPDRRRGRGGGLSVPQHRQSLAGRGRRGHDRAAARGLARRRRRRARSVKQGQREPAAATVHLDTGGQEDALAAASISSSRRPSASASTAAWPTPAARARTSASWPRSAPRAQHGHHDPEPLGRLRSLRQDETLKPRGAQAAELHRQPPGRLAAGRPLQ